MAAGDDLTGGPDDPLSAAVAERLRQAHQRVRALPPGRAGTRRAARRLIAVTNAAKHDLRTASRRLDALLADLEAGRYG